MINRLWGTEQSQTWCGSDFNLFLLWISFDSHLECEKKNSSQISSNFSIFNFRLFGKILSLDLTKLTKTLKDKKNVAEVKNVSK